jgi:hypothetical protein
MAEFNGGLGDGVGVTHPPANTSKMNPAAIAITLLFMVFPS